jgi:flagellum-specific peptidoglycan hydrolase FlgJ
MKLKSLFFGVIMLLGFSTSAQKSTAFFIKGFLPMSQQLQEQWGIPVSIILGVSILESGSGTSLNARQLNNFFGITGKNHIKTRRTVYKQYASAKDCFEDFCGMISRKKFYKALKDNLDYHAWLNAMNKANYAGAKGVWITRVKNIIQKHKLAQYDK